MRIAPVALFLLFLLIPASVLEARSSRGRSGSSRGSPRSAERERPERSAPSSPRTSYSDRSRSPRTSRPASGPSYTPRTSRPTRTPSATPRYTPRTTRPTPAATPSYTPRTTRPTPAATPSYTPRTTRPTPSATPRYTPRTTRPTPSATPRYTPRTTRPTPSATPRYTPRTTRPTPTATPRATPRTTGRTASPRASGSSRTSGRLTPMPRTTVPSRTGTTSRGAAGRVPPASRPSAAPANRGQGFRGTPDRTTGRTGRVSTSADRTRAGSIDRSRTERRPTTSTYRTAPYRSRNSTSHGFYRPDRSGASRAGGGHSDRSYSSGRSHSSSHRGHHGSYDSYRHKRVHIDYRNPYHRSRSHRHYSGWGFYVGFNWSWYFGYSSVSYAQPYVSYHPWNFWWPDPVCVAYVPFGFYTARPAVYVREVTVVREEPIVIREEVPVYIEKEVPVYVDGAAPGALVKTSEYQEGELEATPVEPAAAETDDGPPLLDATTEKYLREGSEAFAAADYKTAAEAFRNAANAAPDAVGPRFAYGQALIAIGDYSYASRILRDALSREPAILRAPGSIAGVYRDAAEFQRVLKVLRIATLENRGDPDLAFLLGYQQFFSGDPQAVVTFTRMRESWPDDGALELFLPVLAERFPALGELPPSEKLGDVK